MIHFLAGSSHAISGPVPGPQARSSVVCLTAPRTGAGLARGGGIDKSLRGGKRALEFQGLTQGYLRIDFRQFVVDVEWLGCAESSSG